MNDNTNEKKQAAASYILNFYNQILMLNDQYSRYLNYLTELEQKYGKDATNKVEAEEKNNLIDLIRNVRYIVTTAHIQYRVISEATKIKDDETDKTTTSKTYSNIRDSLIIKRSDLEAYVFALNKFLINNIIQELLTSSNDFLERIYKENAPSTAADK